MARDTTVEVPPSLLESNDTGGVDDIIGLGNVTLLRLVLSKRGPAWLPACLPAQYGQFYTCPSRILLPPTSPLPA